MSRCLWLLLAVSLLGCSRSEEPDVASESEGSNVLDVETDRDSTAGRWQLVFYDIPESDPSPTPVSIALIEIEDNEAKLLDMPQNGPEFKIHEARIDKTSVQLTLDVNTLKLEFVGKLADSRIRGNVALPGGEAAPAEMLATTSPVLGESAPIAASKEYDDALHSDDPTTAMIEFAAEFPTSPLALMALRRSVTRLKPDAKPDFVQSAVAKYLAMAGSWGEKLERSAAIVAASSLAAKNLELDLAGKLLTDVEQKIEQDGDPELQGDLVLAKRALRIARIEVKLESGDESQQAVGVADLKQMLTENPTDPDVMQRLAEYAEEQDDAEQAIEFYGRLAVLPGYEMFMRQRAGQDLDPRTLPSERAARLWKQEHENLEGFEDRMVELYRDVVHEIGVPDLDITQAGNQTVLVELFTGSGCPPCVAADVATGVVSHKFPADRVFVLRYHQHIPMPDNMVSPASESRFDYYAGQGTPTTMVNGKNVSGGGSVLQSRAVYELLAEAIQPLLSEEAEAEIALSAEVVDETQVAITASVTAQQSLADSYRLRLAIAEDEILEPAPNGILLHEMVVRAMPGGPSGIAAKDGQLAFQGQVDLAVIRNEILDYLDKFERGRDFEFNRKPLEMRKLHVVAWVQDDSTKEVLQARWIPVEVNLPPLEQPGEDSPPTQPADATEATKAEQPAKAPPKSDAADAPESPEKTGATEKSESTEKPESSETTEKPEQTDSPRSAKPPEADVKPKPGGQPGPSPDPGDAS